MITKQQINNFLRKFGIEVHGLNYLQSIRKGKSQTNEFDYFYGKIKKKKPVIFDVGANRGNITTSFLETFPNAEIFAFEPLKTFFHELENKFLAHSNVHISSLGVSDKIEMKEFNLNKSLDTSSFLPSKKTGLNSDESVKTIYKEKIQTTTLDSFAVENMVKCIDILKLDIQGSELNALRGAEKLLMNGCIDMIYCETYFVQQYNEQPSFYEIASYLKDYQFELQDIYNPIYGNSRIAWCDSVFVKVHS